MNVENIKEIVVMKSTLKFLRISCIFPSKEEINQLDKNLYIKYTSLIMMGVYFPVGVALHLLKNIQNSQENYVEEDISILLSFCGVLYFTTQYLRSIKTITVIYKKLSDFESFGKPTNFDKFNQLFNRISIAYFFCHLINISSITLTPVFTAEKCEEENLKRGINEICGMVARMWLPFDYDFFPVKQILIIYQYCVAVLVYQSAGIISFAMFESVQHMSFRFQHLSETFVDLLRIRDPTERRKLFGKAMRYHYTLIELGNMMNHSYGPCFIVHMVLTAPVLGASGYRMVNTAALDAVVMFFGWIISTSFVCTAGQGLQDSSEILSDIVYQTEWYNLEKEFQRDLILVILRSRHPIYLTAGPFGKMTYSLMVTIGKASYSYLTLLQQQVSA